MSPDSAQMKEKLVFFEMRPRIRANIELISLKFEKSKSCQSAHYAPPLGHNGHRTEA